MPRHSFITTVPVKSGSLHRAVKLVAEAGADINRIHYDRQIDPQTVFWEVTCDGDAFQRLRTGLKKLGYLREGLSSVASLKLTVRLPHRTGALNNFLQSITQYGGIITAVAFDDEGSTADTVIISVALEEEEKARALFSTLTAGFHVEDAQFNGLEDTSFYVRFVQQLQAYIPHADTATALDLTVSVNRVAQDLMRLGASPAQVFQNVLEAARTIAETSGVGFYADVQTLSLSDTVTLYCVQPPCGGNIYLFATDDAYTMLDTGYGAYYADVIHLFASLGLDIPAKLTRIILSHGDTDHSGASGYYAVPVHMHRTAAETIRADNRAWGSPKEKVILETVYSKMIATFSRFRQPEPHLIRFMPEDAAGHRSIFPMIGAVDIGDLRFEVLESLGGHQVGSIFLYNPEHGYLFTADSLIYLKGLTPERTRYNKIADYLMTSVNVSSDTARNERNALLEIAADYRKQSGSPCIVFGGHGPFAVEIDGALHAYELPVTRRYP